MLIYGGSAYSYAHDSDFMGVSASEKFWQEVIDKYYAKYYGIKAWHDRLIYSAQQNGKLVIPSGRFFPIVPDMRKRNPWPLTIIKNYPVQGFGADLVMLARLQAFKKIKASGLEAKMISTIHDSIVVDTPSENWYNISKILKESIEDIPQLCEQVFNYKFSLPMTCEVQHGPNKLEMKEVVFED